MIIRRRKASPTHALIVLTNDEGEEWTAHNLSRVSRHRRETFLEDGDRRAFAKLAALCHKHRLARAS